MYSSDDATAEKRWNCDVGVPVSFQQISSINTNMLVINTEECQRM
jgi:hypothetical protein